MDHAVGTEHYVFDDVRGWHADQHDVRVVRHFPRRCMAARTPFKQWRQGVGIGIKQVQVKAFVEQMAGHFLAHGAEADETDGRRIGVVMAGLFLVDGDPC